MFTMFNTVKLLVIAPLLFSASMAISEPRNSDYLAYGMGIILCDETNQHFEERKFQVNLKVWLTGYLTAINAVLSEQSVSLVETDLQGALDSIHAICMLPSNKSISIAEAADTYWRASIKEQFSAKNEDQHNK